MVHHPWPAALDVIWHIYSHLYCSSRDGGRDLPSSGEAAPTMGKGPCEFQADWPGFSFSGEELRQGFDYLCMIFGNFRFHLSVCSFSLNLCNAANWCKELTIFQFR